MKIKRIIAVTLVLCLLSSCAMASIFDDFGKWAESAWNDASKWAEQAWNDASKWGEQAWKDAPAWIENAWGDASKWVEQAWNDSAKWLEGIWGDVSKWANEQNHSAAWWQKTFDDVTKEADNAWKWIEAETQETRETIKKAVSDAGNSIDSAYTEQLEKLNLGKEDIAKVLETLEAYAKEKGIPTVVLKTMLLPYLVKLTADRKANGNQSIPAVAVAQYLIGVFEKNQAKTEEQINQVINTLKESLGL